jgi:predicted component of type VI protein secretion system
MSQTIKLDFEIPQGYYTQEELNNYIKNNISNLLNNSSVDAYSTTKGNITIPLKNIISNIDIDID